MNKLKESLRKCSLTSSPLFAYANSSRFRAVSPHVVSLSSCGCLPLHLQQ